MLSPQHDPDGSASRVSTTKLVGGVALAAFGLWLTLRVGWMSDDGLINIRTALNAKAGAGPVFNAGERVAPYTSPLWFWLQYTVGYVTGEFIISAIVVGALCSTATLLLLTFSARTGPQAFVVILAFALSSTMIDYSTGGLENGIGMLLIALFLRQVARFRSAPSRWDPAILGATGAAVLLTRLDYVVLILPVAVLASVGLVHHGRRAVALCAATFLGPLALWFLWAHSYYGSWVPNTFEAKLNIDIPISELVFAGFRYIAVSIEGDPIIGVLLVAATLLAVLAGSRIHLVAMFGAFAYICYVMLIGGDFMAGRFLTGPIVVALWTVATVEIAVAPRDLGAPLEALRTATVPLALAALIFFVGLKPMVIDRPSFSSPERWSLYDRGGIADEAGHYRQEGSSLTGVLLAFPGPVKFGSEQPLVPLWQLRRLEAMWFKARPPAPGTDRAVEVDCPLLGNAGIRFGPAVHIIDPCGLTDPFLARLTFRGRNQQWRAGHLARGLPDGYLDAVRYADPSKIQDPELRTALERLWARIR